MGIKTNDKLLINDLISLIEEGKTQLAYVANTTLTLTHWRIGKRINVDVLDNKRAEYGKRIVVSVARQLTLRYSKSYEEKNLRRIMQSAQVFEDEQIVATLWRQFARLISRF